MPKHVFWTDGFPRTVSGKIQKFNLNEAGINAGRRGKGALESIEKAKRQ